MWSRACVRDTDGSITCTSHSFARPRSTLPCLGSACVDTTPLTMTMRPWSSCPGVTAGALRNVELRSSRIVEKRGSAAVSLGWIGNSIGTNWRGSQDAKGTYRGVALSHLAASHPPAADSIKALPSEPGPALQHTEKDALFRHTARVDQSAPASWLAQRPCVFVLEACISLAGGRMIRATRAAEAADAHVTATRRRGAP